MNKTTNYQLNQWERSDRVLMEDFNADNAKLDAAIKAVDKRVDGSATQAALNALSQTVAGKTKIAVGAYAGDGQASRTISVGFTPKAVYVCLERGYTFYDSGTRVTYYGGLAVTGHPVGGAIGIAEIVSGGFKVAYASNVASNASGMNYHYIAFG